MIRNMIGLIIVLASAAVLFSLLPAPGVPAGLHGPAGYYVERGVAETGSVNLVTAVVVAYRGLDTLGEVVVLFSASTAVVLILSLIPMGSRPSSPSPVVELTAGVLPGAICLFGIYIITHGHLSPGGGFPGGRWWLLPFFWFFLAPQECQAPQGFSPLLNPLQGSPSGFWDSGVPSPWASS